MSHYQKTKIIHDQFAADILVRAVFSFLSSQFPVNQSGGVILNRKEANRSCACVIVLLVSVYLELKIDHSVDRKAHLSEQIGQTVNVAVECLCFYQPTCCKQLCHTMADQCDVLS